MRTEPDLHLQDLGEVNSPVLVLVSGLLGSDTKTHVWSENASEEKIKANKNQDFKRVH